MAYVLPGLLGRGPWKNADISAFGVMQATLVFVASPPARRAQAMGLLTMCIGTGPIGFLMLGWLAERVGAPAAVAISAAAGLAVLAATWRWWPGTTRRCPGTTRACWWARWWTAR